MFSLFRKTQLPPVAQPALGRSDDREAFTRPEPGLLETPFGYGSDGRVYEMSPEDQKRLRPIFLKSERTIRNERIAAERARRRAVGAPSGDGGDTGPNAGQTKG